jgi:hypothetical protein
MCSAHSQIRNLTTGAEGPVISRMMWLVSGLILFVLTDE